MVIGNAMKMMWEFYGNSKVNIQTHVEHHWFPVRKTIYLTYTLLIAFTCMLACRRATCN
jgi:hypothetical protein